MRRRDRAPVGCCTGRALAGYLRRDLWPGLAAQRPHLRYLGLVKQLYRPADCGRRDAAASRYGGGADSCTPPQPDAGDRLRQRTADVPGSASLRGVFRERRVGRAAGPHPSNAGRLVRRRPVDLGKPRRTTSAGSRATFDCVVINSVVRSLPERRVSRSRAGGRGQGDRPRRTHFRRRRAQSIAARRIPHVRGARTVGGLVADAAVGAARAEARGAGAGAGDCAGLFQRAEAAPDPGDRRAGPAQTRPPPQRADSLPLRRGASRRRHERGRQRAAMAEVVAAGQPGRGAAPAARQRSAGARDSRRPERPGADPRSWHSSSWRAPNARRPLARCGRRFARTRPPASMPRPCRTLDHE